MVSKLGPDSPADSPVTDDAAQLKGKLAWRIGVAAAMIATLLGGLALFDYMASSSGENETAPPIFTEPVPVSKKNTTQALGTVPSSTTEMTGAPAAGVPESTSAPSNRMVVAEGAPTPARPAGGRPHGPAVTTPPAEPVPVHGEVQPRPAAIAEMSTPTPLLRSSVVDTPTTPTPAAAEPPSPNLVSAAKLLSGYTVQAGATFSDPKQAEAVYARLAQEGIPAALETRVLVGPFRTRAEADAARARMKTLGIDASSVRRSGRK